MAKELSEFDKGWGGGMFCGMIICLVVSCVMAPTVGCLSAHSGYRDGVREMENEAIRRGYGHLAPPAGNAERGEFQWRDDEKSIPSV